MFQTILQYGNLSIRQCYYQYATCQVQNYNRRETQQPILHISQIREAKKKKKTKQTNSTKELYFGLTMLEFLIRVSLTICCIVILFYFINDIITYMTINKIK